MDHAVLLSCLVEDVGLFLVKMLKASQHEAVCECAVGLRSSAHIAQRFGSLLILGAIPHLSSTRPRPLFCQLPDNVKCCAEFTKTLASANSLYEFAKCFRKPLA